MKIADLNLTRLIPQGLYFKAYEDDNGKTLLCRVVQVKPVPDKNDVKIKWMDGWTEEITEADMDKKACTWVTPDDSFGGYIHQMSDGKQLWFGSREECHLFLSESFDLMEIQDAPGNIDKFMSHYNKWGEAYYATAFRAKSGFFDYHGTGQEDWEVPFGCNQFLAGQVAGWP